MRLVVDDKVACSAAAFSPFGEVVEVPGAKLQRGHLHDADVLVVRSITRVDAELLEGTRVGFVGSATAGIDHVDVAAMRRLGIEFAHAPGCNAAAVVEHVLAALHVLEGEGHRFDDIGIIGCGQVGRRLVHVLRRLGRRVLVTDPPLARRLARGEDPGPPFAAEVTRERFVRLESLLANSRLVSLHVPLISTGVDRTRSLLDRSMLPVVASDAVVVNTSRGLVLDRELVQAADRDIGFVLDVFPDEPNIPWSWLADPRLKLATPHVAGYALESKLEATAAIHRALAAWLGRMPTWSVERAVVAPPAPIPVPRGIRRRAVAGFATRAAYDIQRLDRELRSLLARPMEHRPAGFESLRAAMPTRRAFSAHRVRLSGELRNDRDLRAELDVLGFSVQFE